MIPGWSKEDRLKLTKGIVKNAGCTIDPADNQWMQNKTDFFKRRRRMHIMQFSSRIFADVAFSSGWDAGWHQPQYIGRGEGANEYRLKGLFLPEDEEGAEYYLQRRLENLHPSLGNQAGLWKSLPAEAPSPSRWTHRSKQGALFSSSTRPSQASSSSSSKAKPSHA